MNVAARLLHTNWLPFLGGLLVISILNACGDGPALTVTSEETTTPVPAVMLTQTPTHFPLKRPCQSRMPRQRQLLRRRPHRPKCPSPHQLGSRRLHQPKSPRPHQPGSRRLRQPKSPQLSPTREPTATSVPTSTVVRPEVTPSPSPAVELAGEATWILESLDGRPLIEESSVTLKMIEDGFVGFDGCNRYDGRSKDGAPIADADGRFSVQDGFRTE